MAGCDGWITIKIFELIFATFCMIYKRVSDDEANKLFYFLQKFSREWPLLNNITWEENGAIFTDITYGGYIIIIIGLIIGQCSGELQRDTLILEWPLLNNITWEENGAIFTDITYGGYIIIIIGLIIGQCSGELQRCRKTEKFFLILGALLFIAAGSLELAAIESVEERLVDNAAILGVFSLLTGFLFIIDLLSASKRRKSEKLKIIEKYMQSKPTQTDEGKMSELSKTNYQNGNIQNGTARFFTELPNGNRIPRNAVKLLPSSPILNDAPLTPGTNANEYTGPVMYSAEPPVIDVGEIKTHEGRIKSTESFLRSEKGFYPKFRKPLEHGQFNNNFIIPPGYVLVSMDQLQGKNNPKSDSGIGDSPTPPGYAKIIPDGKKKPGYVMIPIDQKDGSRKSPTVFASPEFYYVERQERKSRSPNLYRSASAMNSSDFSDVEESKSGSNYKHEMKPQQFHKIPLEYLETDRGSRKYILQSEDSSDEPKLIYPRDFHFRPESRYSLRSSKGSKEWRHYSPKGKVNEGYSVEKETDLPLSSRRSSPYRSGASSPEKPKSILRYGRPPKEENELYLPKDGHYDSLDSQKIAEDLRNLREITKSDLNLSENLEKENKILKERLKVEKKEKEKLKSELEDKRKLEESEEEKNRRMSEREEQYFGIKDLKQSHKDSLETDPKIKHLESYAAKEAQKMRKGAKEINEKLKQKYLEHESKAAREAQEFRDLIDERFHFLHEEDQEKTRKGVASPLREAQGKSGLSETESTPDLNGHSKSSKSRKSDSDEMNSQSTDDDIRLRVETPGSASYKSEALFWLGTDREYQSKSVTPTSPGSPGYVLYTAQNWPDSPSPEDRFHFSSKEAQQLSLGTPPKTPVLEKTKSDFSGMEEKKNSQKLSLLEFEEVPETAEKSPSLRRGLLVRKVDFRKEPVVEVKKPAVVQGSTSTWRKWLYPKPKLQHTRSVPN